MLTIITVLMLCGISQAAVPALTQQAVATGSGSATGAFGVDPTPGDTYIAIITHLSTETIDTVAADDGDVPLAQVTSRTVAGVTTEIWWANGATGGSRNFTAVVVGVGTVSVNFSEWSNLKTGAATATNGNTAVASSTVTTNSVASSAESSLVIAIGGWTANNYSSGPINGFTRMTQTGGTGAFQEGAYLINSGGVAKSTGWTLTLGINWAAAIAVFSAPAATNAQNSAGFFMMSQ